MPPYVFITFRTCRRAANTAQIRIAAVRARWWQAIAVGIALRALLANRHALLAEILKSYRTGFRWRQTTRGVIDVTRVALRANRHTNKFIIIRPIAAGHACPRPRIAVVAIRAFPIVIAAAQAVLTKIGSFRTIGRAFSCFPREAQAFRTIVGNLRSSVRQALFWIAQIPVVAIRAIWQRHGLETFRAAKLAGWQANAGRARIAQITRGALGQAIIVIDRVTRRAAWLSLTGIAGAATGLALHLARLIVESL